MTEETLIQELNRLYTELEETTTWGALESAKIERRDELARALNIPLRKPAESFSYTVPAGCHLVGLYNYTNSARGEDKKGFYAHLILKSGWYDDSGQPLLGTSITGDYCPTPQLAIDDAYAKVKEHVAQINAEIPNRRPSVGLVKEAKSADDLLKLLGL